jgi:hypothetical protein
MTGKMTTIDLPEFMAPSTFVVQVSNNRKPSLSILMAAITQRLAFGLLTPTEIDGF